jgi:hypothetical protein
MTATTHRKENTMDHDEAAKVLTESILDTGSFATLTTSPTHEQREAMRSVDRTAAASDEVCAEMELAAGCTWRDVLKGIHHDAAFG